LHHIVPALPVTIATFGLLFLFLLLTILGIGESAIVALLIFIFHLFTMGVLIVFIGIFIANNGLSIFNMNYALPTEKGILYALFAGFSAAMLGISGFESSANFVEEQEEGVFPKTLRNMWIAVSILNPLIALMAICIMPISGVKEYQNSFLAHLGDLSGGHWLATMISINAVTVLSGAVLTSYVGVGGLIKRMTLDRILPQVLLKENSRGSSYRILTVFFLLCVSVLIITKGELGPLAGVYTISFLSVMLFFAIGNLLLKIKRGRLPRPEYAKPVSVIVAFVAIAIALYGNIVQNPEYLVVFLSYFIPTMLVIYCLMHRNEILEFGLDAFKDSFDGMRKATLWSHLKVKKLLDGLHSQEFIFFSKGDDISVLNKVMIYVQENEITRKLKIVTVLKEGQASVSQNFLNDLEVLDRAYPDIDIEYTQIHGSFGPELVQELSEKWNVPTNFMFISAPSDRFPYRVADLGGVRLIL
jgi:amino acid transporter